MYSFGINYDGLKISKEKDGSIYLIDNKGKKVFSIEVPYMYDSNGESSSNIKIEIKESKLSIIADSDWINKSTRKFPVIIDPTIVTSRSLASDIMISSGLFVFGFDGYKTNNVGRRSHDVKNICKTISACAARRKCCD